MPILSVLFGYLFFNESLNRLRILSIILTFFSVLYYLLLQKFSFDWISGRFFLVTFIMFLEKINIEVDLGLFIESLLILPFALIGFYFIYE